MGEYNRISLEKLRIFLKIVKTPYIPYKSSKPPTFPLRKVIFPVGIPYNLRMAKIPYGRGFPLRVAALKRALSSLRHTACTAYARHFGI